MVLISSEVQVPKGRVVCDCFHLMASTTVAGVLFVRVPMLGRLGAGYVGIFRDIFFLRESVTQM